MATRSRKNGKGQGSPTDTIRIRGARVHNLQNLDLDIPREQIVVITGLSGSGKSSLAFDTLFAEGRRQFIESLSIYARQFLVQLERPDVDLIEGLQPTISINQRAGSQNPRSTVATITEIYDHFRLLWARVGKPYCYRCGEPIRHQTPEQILDEMLALPPRTKAVILVPYVRGRKGQHKDVFVEIRKAGFVRARVDGEMYDIESVPELVRQRVHHIEAVVDRIVIREGIRPRLAESVQLALKYGDGVLVTSLLEPSAAAKSKSAWRDQLFSTQYACPSCRLSYEELEPRTFSFNSPYGACAECEGLGYQVEFDPELVVPDRGLSLSAGAIAPWRGSRASGLKRHKKTLSSFASANGFRWNTPLSRLRPRVFEALLRGNGKKFHGVLTWLHQQYVTATRASIRSQLETFRGPVRCAACDAARLRPEARSVRVGGMAIYETTAMTVDAARTFVRQLEFPKAEAAVARPIVDEIQARLDFLDKVGLAYLTLDRGADTLSGGEAQRIRLASGLGSGLVGVCYVLDEPSIGLHPRDNQRLIDALRDLQRQGNTVLVVEHDEAMIRQADHLIDLGPGAGHQGGRLVAQGAPDDLARNPQSVTGRYLAGQRAIPLPEQRRKIALKRSITIQRVTTNNLKAVDVRVPLSVFVCVTGVSGSGKSSLLEETLARAVMRKLGTSAPKPGPHASLRGVNQIDKLVPIDQTPIGRTPRSNPATYTGIFDEIRKIFTGTRDARLRGYKAGRFSFNVKGGRCDQCQGQGIQKIEMNFLPDLNVTCPVCEGKRFNRQTLAIRYRDRSIADVLDMCVDEAARFFENFPAITRLLACLKDVGLGYVALGQSSTTLSGGEAQRIKLATELGRVDTGRTLYILDEPTTGLHFEDVRQLLTVLNRLVDLGNTVVVIEHHLDVIKSADWIIDLGPEGGERGGYVLATGTPEQVAAVEDNETGRHLTPLLNGRRNADARRNSGRS